MSASEDELRRLAEQAAASADDTRDPVTVGREEWLALLDAIERRPVAP